MIFLLARHCATDWNLNGRIQGQTDNKLNDQGREEARKLRKKLMSFSISKIISSDLVRAKQTVEIINDCFSVPIYFEKGLRECHFGLIEGLTLNQAVETFGQKVLTHFSRNYISYDLTEYGGESKDMVLKRHLEIFKKHAKTLNHTEQVLIVGHGRALATLLAYFGQDPGIKRVEIRCIKYPL